MDKIIAKPIAKISVVLDRIAEGDLTVDQVTVKTNDEIKVLSNSISKMVEGLKMLISNILKSAENISSSSEELTATSEQTAVACETVAKTITEIARGASDQANDTEKAASRAVEMGTLLGGNKENINYVSQSYLEIGRKKEEGFSILRDLVEKTETSNKAAQTVHDIIMSNNESAEKIEGASVMIQNIADQTNLLALNAAIEAARAGEAGKGFAVVAEEIRKLAEQSNKFTIEIKEIIEELKGNSESAANTMNLARQIVEEQGHSVSKTEEKFEMIARAVVKADSIVERLSHSSILLDKNKDLVLEIMENLSAIAQENAASTEEASAAIQEQTASVVQVSHACEGLSLIAMDLMAMVRKFKI